ncbi:Eco57I restriction-modification methylase domain-containing protein [Methylosinus sp. KRF6]|uniref:Eco57I restriction-modification methylase domain-containing protein n=1 Tax=Methylosinus sp. KRF6 TaxID=2846853 RepID=UPI001C0B13B0|nr:DNA methyltransferase [Methylosinus sp. KRF6]MBU3888767.1 N-6 DNA methylase [Methylosinus sp. KRF6]
MTYQARPDETVEWLNYLQPEGLVVGPNILRERGLNPIRQTPLDTEDAAQALGLPTDARREDDRLFELHDVWRFFETVLDWSAKLVAGAPGGPAIPPELTITVPEHETLLAPDMVVLWKGDAPEGVPAQALVMLHPSLEADDRNQFPSSEWEASPHQRLERLLRETNVGVGLLVARNTLRLVYAPRGETAGWLSWPLAPLGRVEGRPMLAGLKLCLGRSAFFAGTPETRLRALLEASRAAQNEVSEKLSGQVLGALHELLRGLHRAAPERIEALAENNPQHLYEGQLTCLMRLVFLLYAEDRDLLPSSPEPALRQLWEKGYSIKTLYMRLLTDEALNPDTMDDRRGGWGQLLAVFRLIHTGYPGWVTGRGGKLFDPEGFPFLEGREKGEDREAATVLPVSDGCILRILHGLMTIEGRSLSNEKIRERLSYRSLDVESIGSVYETVMGFTTDRASERMIALRDEKKLPTFIGLDTLLAQKPADRQKWLKDRSIKLSAKQAKAVKEAGDVAALVEAFGTLVDDRASPKATPIGPGAPFLQPTEERRRSGSHYTPRSLTEPIVRHALEPAFERIGERASPEAVLGLKILDPACGSGAFLVEACRQLGQRLEQAWNMYGAEKPVVPPDEDEALHARRLVAQKCLYGVDRNPMAVDLARLSLWLATLARDHEFTFLDHALKSGDSLVGLTRDEIAAAHWDASKPGLPLFRDAIKKAVEGALQGREAIRNAGDDVRIEAQAARYSRVLDASEPARIVGDAVIAAFFSADKPRGRETERQKVESWIAGSLTPDWEQLHRKGDAFRAEQGWRPFHWEIEFPEVFARDESGFDAIVGNPPFLGGKKISEELGENYNASVSMIRPPSTMNADLVAHFFRRAFNLLNSGGAFGLVATNTIKQADTREASLDAIVRSGGFIFRATRRLVWPGEAAVIVSVIHISKNRQNCNLDGKAVSTISPFLVEGSALGKPPMLHDNAKQAFNGSMVLGAGFLFDDAGAARGVSSSLNDMEILANNHDNSQFIFPYVSGEDINNIADGGMKRGIVDFADLEEAEAKQRSPELYFLLKRLVQPERLTQKRKDLRERWWQFAYRKSSMYRKIRSNADVIVCAYAASPHMAFRFWQTNVVFSNTVCIIASNLRSRFCVLQSRVHEIWARFFASSMKDDLRYTPSDCFETFPFPQGYETDAALEAIGQAYHDHRAALMIAADEGMTKTYNRFHKADERGEPIRRLRELHDEMDRAVLRAYGWDDLAEELRPEFLTEETEDDHTYQNRYFWPAEQRDRVLARLLALNAERHAEEVAAGLAPERGARRSAEEADEAQDVLDLS